MSEQAVQEMKLSLAEAAVLSVSEGLRFVAFHGKYARNAVVAVCGRGRPGQKAF